MQHEAQRQQTPSHQVCYVRASYMYKLHSIIRTVAQVPSAKFQCGAG